jgi:hypothetical protein
MDALSYVGSYFGGAAKTTLNVALYAATLGKFVLLEGRVSGGIFENWAGMPKRRILDVELGDAQRNVVMGHGVCEQ